MLLMIADWLSEYHSGFRVFHYLTMRSILGTLTALFIAFLVGPTMIRRLTFHKIGQAVRDDGPETHFKKAGTPTMGGTSLVVPFFKDVSLQLGWFFVPLTYFVIVGTSNAVNLTDGLDGLAIMPTVLVAGALGIFAYLSGNAQFAQYLAIPSLQGTGELVVFCGAIVGAGMGFLWFNAYPAMVFMGDVGALALGAALGVLAVLVRQELVLIIMGGVFVMETVSVILQVASFKLTGKRIFRMAPIHHHYELKGWPEPRIIVRFWIITVILVLIGLSTLKLR